MPSIVPLNVLDLAKAAKGRAHGSRGGCRDGISTTSKALLARLALLGVCQLLVGKMMEIRAGALQAANRWLRTYPDADRCAPHAVLSAECASAAMEVSGRSRAAWFLVMTYYLACCDTSCFLTSLRSEAPYLRTGRQHAIPTAI